MWLVVGVTQEISASVRYHIQGPWPTWTHYPKQLKQYLWRLFKGKYTWADGMTRDIKNLWGEIADRRLRDMLCKERSKATLKVKSNNPLDWRGHGPDWLGQTTWNKLCENHWNTEKFQTQSKAGKNNRRSTEDGSISTHTGGSKPFVVHEQDMEDEYKRKVSKVELYDRTHRKNQGNGDFACPKAKRVRGKYDSLVENNSQNSSSQPIFDPAAWIEASGGVPKGRVYGFWSQSPHRILGDIAHRRGSKSKLREAYECAQEESDERFAKLQKDMEQLKGQNHAIIKIFEQYLPEHLPDNIRRMLEEIQWTNHTHAGGSGLREQEFVDSHREGRRYRSLGDSDRDDSDNTRSNDDIFDANEGDNDGDK